MTVIADTFKSGYKKGWDKCREEIMKEDFTIDNNSSLVETYKMFYELKNLEIKNKKKKYLS